MKPLATLFAVLSAATCMPAAQAARPFVTDDARIVERGGCQVETFYKRQRAYHGPEFWFLPACSPFGVELTAGANRIEGDPSLVLQAKTLLRRIEPNGAGFALTLGSFATRIRQEGREAWSPYVNGIASFAFGDDAVVLHANLGAIRDRVGKLDRGTWGVGAEVRLAAPRLYGIVETYGQRGEKPTRHVGLRYWIQPDRLQLDSTLGERDGEPRQRFFTVGLRFLFGP
jgi:hypothetical protein